jgi:hypothetical protein
MDLVPFGFTPTESTMYRELVTRGSTSAYALSKAVGVARANTYQALNGLVAKGAAILVTADPQVFKPVAPEALLALIAARQASSLDKLEKEVQALGLGGAPSTIDFDGNRPFGDLALRTAVRAASVTCLAPIETLVTLTPIWRKRVADDARTMLWRVGTSPQDLSLTIAGEVGSGAVADLFGSDYTVCLVTESNAIIGRRGEEEQLKGFWSADPLWVGAIRGAILALTT